MDERFWEKVDVRGPDDCWPWTGYLQPCGHGRLNIKGTPRPSHVIAVMLAGREVPPGHEVHHDCRNRACCNERHLKVLTILDHKLLHAQELRTGCAKHGPDDMARIKSGKNRGKRYCKACNREKVARAARRRKRELGLREAA